VLCNITDLIRPNTGKCGGGGGGGDDSAMISFAAPVKKTSPKHIVFAFK
jgi:hypothetical protein